MAGLLDYLDNPAFQGLLAAGFGGLTSRTVAGGIGRGGLLGLTAYNNAQNGIAEREMQGKRNQMFDLQLSQHQQSLDAAKASAEQAAMRRNYLAGAGQVTSPIAGAAPNQFDPTKWISLGGSIEEAQALANRGNWGKAKIKDYKDIKNPDGSVTVTGFDEFGQPVNTGAAPFKAPEVRDFGGYVGGIDPITGKVSNYGAKTMSAAERDASSRGWAGVNLSREQFNYGKAKDTQERQDKLSGAGGALNATEGERKAATLLHRLRSSHSQMLDAIGGSGKGQAPEVSAEVMRNIPFVGGDTLANLASSPERQRVEAAQLDILDAGLTLATGAAYTKEQLRGYAKSYFPQIGDDPATISDKAKRLQSMMESAEIAAGRAAPRQSMPQPAAQASGGWSIRPKGQ